MKEIKYKIYTLGCKVNQYDSFDLERKLKKIGFKSVEKWADIVFVNTCSVTKTAIIKDNRMASKARQENPEAKIVFMGCYPKSYREEIKSDDFDLIWGVGDFDKLIKTILNFNFSTQNQPPMTKFKEEKSDKTRYFIKVQDGCEQFCSYCVIPYNRGKLQFKKRLEVIKEIKEVVSGGCGEIVLSGIHLGLYGYQRIGGVLKKEDSLVGLIQEIIKIEGIKRIRLSSIESMEISDDLIKIIKNEKKICKHLHIPLQSGCDKILKAMNRPYSRNEFEKKIIQIKKEIPDIAISTDVIVGFPSETEDDFIMTCDFVKKMKFSKLHVFSFSAHEKTPAFKMLNQIKKSEVAVRSKVLRDIGEKLQKEFQDKFKGKKLEILVEGKKNNGRFGKTEYYFDVKICSDIIDGKKIKRGDIIEIVL